MLKRGQSRPAISSNYIYMKLYTDTTVIINNLLGWIDSIRKTVYERINMSTSIKHRRFVCEPIKNKLVTDIPGIGAELGQRLNKRGIKMAYIVLGRFLILEKDKQAFTTWLKIECGANALQGKHAYDALEIWTDEFL